MELTSSANSVHVVLVHGTFARNAPWTESSSPLCQNIQAGLPGRQVNFHAPKWSATNSHSDRVRAGSELATFLIDLLRQHPAPCFLVGHSHGGTVISQALRQSPELADLVDGSVFLSTPFIQVRRKDYWQDLMSWAHMSLKVIVYSALFGTVAAVSVLLPLPAPVTMLAFASCFLLEICLATSLIHSETMAEFSQRLSSNRVVFAFFASTVFVGQVLNEAGIGSSWIPIARGVVIWGAALTSGAVAAWLLYSLMGPAKEEPSEKPLRLELALSRVEETFACRNIRAERALFIRGNNDEANAGLVWVQVVCRLWSVFISLPLRAAEIGTGVTRLPALWRRQPRHMRIVWGSLIVFGLGPSAIAMAAALIVVLWQMTFYVFGANDPFQLDRQFNNFFQDHPRLELFMGPGDGVVKWLIWLYPLLFAGVVFGSLGLVALGRAFGAWFVWTSPFLDISIEPVPPGRWRLLQIKGPNVNPNWSPFSTPELAHAIYLSPEAQEATAKWIHSKCFRNPVSDSDQAGPTPLPKYEV